MVIHDCPDFCIVLEAKQGSQVPLLLKPLPPHGIPCGLCQGKDHYILFFAFFLEVLKAVFLLKEIKFIIASLLTWSTLLFWCSILTGLLSFMVSSSTYHVSFLIFFRIWFAIFFLMSSFKACFFIRIWLCFNVLAKM